MKKYHILFSLLTISILSFSQDLIVTSKNDSIKGTITNITNFDIFYTNNIDAGVNEKKIELSNISFYVLDYYKKKERKKILQKGNINIHFFNDNIDDSEIEINGGYSNILGEIENNGLQNYYKALKQGFHVESSMKHFLSNKVALGIKYNFLFSEIDMYKIQTYDSYYGRVNTLYVSGDVQISFIGPLISFRFHNKTNFNAFQITLSPGYIAYKENFRFHSITYTVMGHTIGLSGSLSYNIHLAKQLYLTLNSAMFLGTISHYTVTGETNLDLGTSQKPISATHLDLSVGLKFMIF